MFELMNEFGGKNTPFLFVVDFTAQHSIILPLDHAATQGIFFNIKGLNNYTSKNGLPQTIFFQKSPIPFSKYQTAFEYVQNQLHQGHSFLTNLTFPTSIETNLTLQQIFEYSNAPYRLWFKDQFTVFSPEPFVTIKDGQIASFPMKGTIKAAIFDAEQRILSDTKEKAEHNTIVDLIRNDLSQVASKVGVERFRYIDKVKNWKGELLQVSSKIVGELPTNYAEKLGDIFQQLLPAGSISGAPKPKTLDIIQTAEGYERGYYTGVFGYYMDGRLESGVMIRFIEKAEQGLVYKSGGGITVYSEVEKEYQELIDKVYVPIHRNHSHLQRESRKLIAA